MHKPDSKNGRLPNRRERRKELRTIPHSFDEVGSKRLSRLPLKRTLTSPLFWSAVVIVIGGFLFFAYPRILIYPEKSARPGQPFETTFVLKNEGYMPIDGIRYSLSMENIEFGQGNTLPHAYSGINENSVPRLSVGKSATVSLNPFIDLLKQSFGIVLPPKTVTFAEISVHLSFRPYLIPYTFTERIRFETKLSHAGDDYMWSERRSQK